SAADDALEVETPPATEVTDATREPLGGRRAGPDASTATTTATAATAAQGAPTPSPDAASAARDAGVLARTRDEALADENALITQAQSALARGRASEALAALREHQRRFPSGRFVEEREAMTVQALARTGQTEQARAR